MKKKHYMMLSRCDTALCQSIRIDKFKFKRVEEIKYLDTILNEKKNSNRSSYMNSNGK